MKRFNHKCFVVVVALIHMTLDKVFDTMKFCWSSVLQLLFSASVFFVDDFDIAFCFILHFSRLIFLPVFSNLLMNQISCADCAVW